MEQKSLARLLKGIVIGMGICGIVIYFVVIPYLGQELLNEYPEFSGRYYPWLFGLWITGIPCYAALCYGWKIAVSIGLDQSFTEKNAQRLKMISYLAIGDAAFFFCMNVVYLFLNMNHPGILIFSMFIVLAGVVISVVAAALSHLVKKAAALQEENDLTI